jgi:hypothetical protein
MGVASDAIICREEGMPRRGVILGEAEVEMEAKPTSLTWPVLSLVFIFIMIFLGGMVVGGVAFNRPCEGCEHIEHGNRTCLKQVPCILGTVACTCEGMELKRKQMLLNQKD